MSAYMSRGKANLDRRAVGITPWVRLCRVQQPTMRIHSYWH